MDPCNDVHCLNAEQKRAYEIITCQKKNVALLGLPGCGKTFLISYMYDAFLQQGRKVALTALTGCAALLLHRRAMTLHSWAGVGLAKDPVDKLLQKVRKSPSALKRWIMTDVLIIDEVSMMTPEFLEKLDAIAKKIRKNTKPMGGLQIVLVGDFYQLPPVVTDGKEVCFIFESPLWKEVVHEIVELKQIMRQNDPVFQDIITHARDGSLTQAHMDVLHSRMNLDWKSLRIMPTLIFSRRAEVTLVNQQNLEALEGKARKYEASTVFGPECKLPQDSTDVKYAVAKLDRDSSYEETLVLKKNAQVMLLQNRMDDRLVNGSRGIVVGFGPEPGYYPIVEFLGGSEPVLIEPFAWESDTCEGVFRKQIPLRLAYAVTIHKSQGATLDCALIDIGEKTFECGQAYVALSRVKSLDSLYIWDVEPSAFKTNPKVIAFYKNGVGMKKKEGDCGERKVMEEDPGVV